MKTLIIFILLIAAPRNSIEDGSGSFSTLHFNFPLYNENALVDDALGFLDAYAPNVNEQNGQEDTNSQSDLEDIEWEDHPYQLAPLYIPVNSNQNYDLDAIYDAGESAFGHYYDHIEYLVNITMGREILAGVEAILPFLANDVATAALINYREQYGCSPQTPLVIELDDLDSRYTDISIVIHQNTSAIYTAHESDSNHNLAHISLVVNDYIESDFNDIDGINVDFVRGYYSPVELYSIGNDFMEENGVFLCDDCWEELGWLNYEDDLAGCSFAADNESFSLEDAIVDIIVVNNTEVYQRYCDDGNSMGSGDTSAGNDLTRQSNVTLRNTVSTRNEPTPNAASESTDNSRTFSCLFL